VAELQRERPDVLKRRCGAQEVLELIANKWTALVIYVLARGTKRHAELRREIDGVSQKMLTQTLRNLERDGLVRRTVYPVVPPRVEYALTPLGRTLIEPLGALCHWSERHFEELRQARERYDAEATE
jgi:DNA-binding HxlR family transcriptional regulator